MQDKKGKMTLGEMAENIKKNVGITSVEVNGKKQTPTVNAPSNLANSWKDMKLTGK